VTDPEQAATQLEIPHPAKLLRLPMPITGPAIAVAPDGGVWVSLLAAQGAVVRVVGRIARAQTPG
jgi:hypothetical protein